MARLSSQRSLELWGGIECTINRVDDRFFSQLALNGHLTRPEDLDRFAALGIRTLRYPILWEHLAPRSIDEIDWSWADERLGQLRDLGIRPIVGLLHHGSGPAYTSLIDPEFPAKFAQFARAVAERYPWIDAYTPVNEPLTTARFSGLYGHWYPHRRDEAAFAQCLFAQLRGITLAMRAIREINPHAGLVQTDDLGKTFATRRLQYQADFENERRWITWDLLCGIVGADHRMFHHLRWTGVPAADIEWFAANPCPPDIIGINYYVTSERMLDDNIGAHPPEFAGGNGRDHYADVPAVRAWRDGIAGAKTLVREACERYARPVAITEAHLGCSRAEQLRWFTEIWESAKALRAEGLDVRAVTSWSLFGANSWDNLLTRDDGCYEPGAFDVRGDEVRPTAIARMIRDICDTTEFRHPVLSVPGWWHRSIRFVPRVAHAEEPFVQHDARPLLIIGNDGGIADAMRHGAHDRGFVVRVISAEDALANAPAIMDELRPWAVAICEMLPAQTAVASLCAQRGMPLIALSSGAVFAAVRTLPAVEGDAPDSSSDDGRALADAERAMRACNPRAIIARTGEIFGARNGPDIVASVWSAFANREPVIVAENRVCSVAYLPDCIAAALDLLVDEEAGIWHLAHEPALSLADFARTIADASGFDAGSVLTRPHNSPAVAPLASRRGHLLPPLISALRHYTGILAHERSTVDAPVAACL